MAETLAKSSFQLDQVCVKVEPFSNHQGDSGVNLDYIAIKLWSEILNFSFSTMPEVA